MVGVVCWKVGKEDGVGVVLKDVMGVVCCWCGKFVMLKGDWWDG